MDKLTRDRAADSVSRDLILRRKRGQGHSNFPYSIDLEQDCRPYRVDSFDRGYSNIVFV